MNGRPNHAPMTPRAATEGDAPVLARLINEAYRVEDFFVDGDRTSVADVRRKLAEANGCFLVIDRPEADRVDEVTLDGAVYVEVRGDRGYFAMLSVTRARQGRGLGRGLVAAVEAHCRAAGCHWLDIEVVDLRTELPAFYASLGFSPCGVGPFPDPAKLRRPAHVVLMTKAL
jgi:GNAT superfamily N-acetyltransferase